MYGLDNAMVTGASELDDVPRSLATGLLRFMTLTPGGMVGNGGEGSSVDCRGVPAFEVA